MKFKFDPIILYIFAAILLAFFLPNDWIQEYGNIYDKLVAWGVSLIFFLYGIKIPYTDFLHSIKKWKLHLTIQSSTYILFPIIIIGSCLLLINDWTHPILIGFLFLAVLPSTVSSSVVMTSWADGNVAAAVFNSFITGILGIILTPLWMSILIDTSTVSFDIGSVYLSLFTEVFLPLMIGVGVQKWCRNYILRYPNILANYDKLIIFLIIFKAFSILFRDQLLSLLNWEILAAMFLAVIVLFAIMSVILLFISKKMNVTYKDKMTLYFCGVQKSFVHATVFSKTIFKTSPQLGFILLPTMIYHLFQIILTSVLAQIFKLAQMRRNTSQNQ